MRRAPVEEDQQRVIDSAPGPRASNNDSRRAKSASAQIFSRIEISGLSGPPPRARLELAFLRKIKNSAQRRAAGSDFFSLTKKKRKTNPAARAFVADRSSIAICTTTQHNTTQHNTATQPNTTHAREGEEKIVSHPRFSPVTVSPPRPETKEKGFRDADEGRARASPFFRPFILTRPVTRVDTGPTRTVARRSASASPPRRPRAAGPRARRGASPRARPTSRGAPAARSARP